MDDLHQIIDMVQKEGKGLDATWETKLEQTETTLSIRYTFDNRFLFFSITPSDKEKYAAYCFNFRLDLEEIKYWLYRQIQVVDSPTKKWLIQNNLPSEPMPKMVILKVYGSVYSVKTDFRKLISIFKRRVDPTYLEIIKK